MASICFQPFASVLLARWHKWVCAAGVERSTLHRSDGHMLLNTDSYGISTTRRSNSWWESSTLRKSLSQPYSRWARCSQSGSKKVSETLPFRLAVSREVSNRLGKLNISLWGMGIRKSRIQIARCGLATVGSGDNPEHVALLTKVRAR
ncbi:hypothetical protein Q3G72_022084 [Acer saccharum]|nr:hypothetical protein Q3G72_022084 [Acer saccharum]